MAPLDWSALLALAPSITIAVAFGFFMLRFLDRQDKQLADANTKAAEERAIRAKANADERKERDANWQLFLKEEREARTAWANAAATQLTQMATLITSTNLLITQHDTWERAVSDRRES